MSEGIAGVPLDRRAGWNPASASRTISGRARCPWRAIVVPSVCVGPSPLALDSMPSRVVEDDVSSYPYVVKELSVVARDN